MSELGHPFLLSINRRTRLKFKPLYYVMVLNALSIQKITLNNSIVT